MRSCLCHSFSGLLSQRCLQKRSPSSPNGAAPTMQRDVQPWGVPAAGRAWLCAVRARDLLRRRRLQVHELGDVARGLLNLLCIPARRRPGHTVFRVGAQRNLHWVRGNARQAACGFRLGTQGGFDPARQRRFRVHCRRRAKVGWGLLHDRRRGQDGYVLVPVPVRVDGLPAHPWLPHAAVDLPQGCGLRDGCRQSFHPRDPGSGHDVQHRALRCLPERPLQHAGFSRVPKVRRQHLRRQVRSRSVQAMQCAWTSRRGQVCLSRGHQVPASEAMHPRRHRGVLLAVRREEEDQERGIHPAADLPRRSHPRRRPAGRLCTLRFGHVLGWRESWLQVLPIREVQPKTDAPGHPGVHNVPKRTNCQEGGLVRRDVWDLPVPVLPRERRDGHGLRQRILRNRGMEGARG
mmetsp:Transcript_30547/g.73389  ORF Transcript_30547/g.73389 Transcript_30547/m.73389 type:complete len:404 (-) Transcript_30547:1490-2701(-)